MNESIAFHDGKKQRVSGFHRIPVVSLSKILFDKLSKHFQNFHKSSENAVIENERHP